MCRLLSVGREVDSARVTAGENLLRVREAIRFEGIDGKKRTVVFERVRN